MRRINVPSQILRLTFLTGIIVTAYLAARFVLTPDSFRQFGFYRGDALAENASRKPVYAGSASCQECHAEAAKVLASFEHKSVACEACHAASQVHVEDPAIKTLQFSVQRCVRCHEETSGRPTAHAQVVLKDHYPGDSCLDCHFPHKPKESP